MTPETGKIVESALVPVLWSPTLPDETLDRLEELVDFTVAMHGGDPELVISELLREAVLREFEDADDLSARCIREVADQAELQLLDATDPTTK